MRQNKKRGGRGGKNQRIDGQIKKTGRGRDKGGCLVVKKCETFDDLQLLFSQGSKKL